MTEKAINRLTEQQKGFGEDNKLYWVAEQIKDICREGDAVAELVFQDLGNPQMSVAEVEKKIAEYAKKHGGCTPPQAADRIIREFYGLPAKGTSATPSATADIIDLDDLI